ncbi:MAG: pyrroline-5-carboxylate reductase family protein [Micrococcaceae bacterium]
MSGATTVGVIGTGEIGGALLGALAADGVMVRGTSRSEAGARAAAESWGAPVESVEAVPGANRALAEACDVVVLAVVPGEILATAQDIAEALREGAVVVSVAAGVTLEALREALPGPRGRVLRALPNLGGAVGKCVTGLGELDAGADADAVDAVRAVFQAYGTVVSVRDDQLDAVSSISGTGPGSFLWIVREMCAAAERLGFTAAQARELVHGTFLGTAALLERAEQARESDESGVTGEADADAVVPGLLGPFTHPDSTSIHALTVLEGANLSEVFQRAAEASMARAREIAGGGA